MTSTNAIDDLNYLKSLAEEGASAPNIGGRFYIVFGILGSIALLSHWAIASGISGLSNSAIPFVWIAYALVTPIAIFLLCGTIASKPGQESVGNRFTRSFWIVAGPSMFAIWIALSYAAIVRNIPAIVFDMLPILAFFLYGVVYMVEARLEKTSWKRFAGLGGIASAAIMAAFIGTAEAYLGAAIATLLIGVIPGAIMMRNEPKSIV